MFLQIFFSSVLFFSLILPASYGAQNGCIQDKNFPPCGGQSGRCTQNSDYSLGGFVADTATVEVNAAGKNIPYLDRYTQVCDFARVSGQARVSDNAQIFDNAWVSGNARIYGNVMVFGDAQVYGSARVYGDAQVFQGGQVFEEAWVAGYARVYENAQVAGNARVFGKSFIYGDALVSGNTEISGSARIFGTAWISGDARVYKGDHHIPAQENLLIFSQDGIRISAYGQTELSPELKARVADCLKYLNAAEKDDICSICLDPIREQFHLGCVVYTRCQHTFCQECFDRSLERDSRCSLCRQEHVAQKRVELEWE